MTQPKKPEDKKPRGSRRRNPVGFDPRRDERRLRAVTRTEERTRRSMAEQLEVLGTRPGAAKRERSRLGTEKKP